MVLRDTERKQTTVAWVRAEVQTARRVPSATGSMLALPVLPEALPPSSEAIVECVLCLVTNSASLFQKSFSGLRSPARL